MDSKRISLCKGHNLPLSDGIGLKRAESIHEPYPRRLSSSGVLTKLRRHLFALDGGQFIALLLTVFAVAPLTYPGFFRSHSGFLAIYNLYDLERHAGLLGLGWLPTVGHAFDLFRSGGALPYVVAEVFVRLGMTAPQAVMASFGTAFLVGVWAMYRWVRRWLGRDSALLAAVLYTYMPYHLMSVYVRGSLSDAWVLALLPLTLWLAEHLDATPRRWAQLLALLVSFALLCMAHFGLALLWLPVLAGYVWSRGYPDGRLGPMLTGGVLLAVAGIAHVWGSRSVPPDVFDTHFPYLFQFLSPAWNVEGQVTGWLNAIPLQIGLASLGLGLLATALLVVPRPADRPTPQPPTAGQATTQTRKALWYWLLVASGAFLLMLSPLRFVWQLTAWERLLTYPWQMLGFLGLALAVVGGAVIALDERLQGVLVRTGLVTFVILASYNYLTPRFWDFDIDFTPEGKVPHVYSMPPREAPLAILGDNQIALLDLQIEGPLRHGATVRANVLWQALRPPEKDYKVFIHVVDASGQIWGQRDTEPLAGVDPTSHWGEGQIVRDRYEFSIDIAGPREGYGLEIGMYDPDTGARLPLSNGETKLMVHSE